MVFLLKNAGHHEIPASPIIGHQHGHELVAAIQAQQLDTAQSQSRRGHGYFVEGAIHALHRHANTLGLDESKLIEHGRHRRWCLSV